MATPLEIANAPGARRGVVVYRPQAQQRQAPAPTRRTTPRGATRAPGPVDWDALKQKAMSTKAAQRKQEQAFQKEAKDEAWDKASWHEKGLGMVLGNPIVRNALVPLNYLQALGRTGTLATEEAAEALPGAPPLVQTLVSQIPGVGGLLHQVDTERTEADTRSNWSKVLAPDTDYGYGQLLNPDNPKWVNRIAGLGLDVGLDPLNYASFGGTRLAGGVQRGARAAEEAGALSRLSGEVAMTARQVAEQEAILRRVAESTPATKQGIWAENRLVPVRQGRRARESLLGEVAEVNPQLLVDHGDELRRGAQRGFSTIKDPVLREALGLEAPGVEFLGLTIPKSGKVAQAVTGAQGAARAGLNKVPLLEPTLARFTPRGLEEASGVLSRGRPGSALRSATAVRIQNLMRQGSGRFEGEANKALTDLVRSLKGMGGDDEIRRLFREAEASDAPNALNEFFGRKVPEMYERISGHEFKVSRDPDTYVPHMHTPEGRRFLATLDKETTQDMGFQADDLLEGSKYLEKSRKLTPKVIGEPTEFKIGNHGTITLTDGTVEELNDELARLFPEFKGKFYDDDPVRIGEAYISSVARQAGRDLALDRLGDSANPLVKQVTGELLDSVNIRNAYLRKNPVVDMIKRGHTAGQRLLPARPKGDMPVTPHDNMFATTLHKAETQTARQAVMKEGKQFIKDVGADVSTTRSTLAENLKNLRTQLMEGLKSKTTKAENRIKSIDLALGRMDDEIRKVGPLTSENVDDLVGISTTVDASIADAKAEIKKIRDRYGKKIPRDQARVEKELQSTLRRLEDQQAKVRSQYAKGTSEMRAEAAARKAALEEPIKAAKIELDRATAAVGPAPVSKERVQAANATIRQGFETEDAFEAERQLYFEALNVLRDNQIPIRRTVDGRLTPETTEAVQEVVADLRKVEPPPAAAAPEEAGAAVTPAAPVAPEPPPVAPAAPDPALIEAKRVMTDAYREAVEAGDDELADSLEEQLDALDTQIRAAGAVEPAPAVPAAPTNPPSTKVVKQASGNYASEDGFEAIKTTDGWLVMLDGVDDLGTFKTLKEAREEIAHQQAMLALPSPAAPAAPESVATSAAAEAVEPSAAVPPAPQPEAPAPTTKRITRKWTTKDFHGHDVEALEGPDAGWTVEPFEESWRRPPPSEARGYLPEGAQGPRPQVAPITRDMENQGPRRLRYVAVHSSDEGMVGRSFASAREAKIAVEDMLRRRRHTETLAEYEARATALMQGEVMEGTQISNLREVPRQDLSPEQAQANIAASAAAPNLQRPQPAGPNPVSQMKPTEAGEWVEGLRPPGQPRNVDPYWSDYEAWKAMEARSTDESLPPAERAKAKRTARSMGGDFTQKSGKHYNRHAAQNIITEDAAHTAKIEADEAVQAAQAKVDAAVANADAQVEAMVYAKAHNPITGEDDYTRLPAGSTIGFGDDAIGREPILPTPPRQGEVPTGTMETDRPWSSRRTPMDRDADRRVLDSPEWTPMMPENQRAYDDLTQQGLDIQTQLDNAATNEASLREADRAAQRAYTEEVKAADQAVLEAKRAQTKAQADLDEGNVMGAGLALEEAKRNTQRAVDAQTQVRQTWMRADKAWKDMLADRDAYQAARNDVTRAEQALYADSGNGQKFIDAIRDGRPISSVTGRDITQEQKNLARNLVQADQKLQAMEDAGLTFLTDNERRRLVGTLNSIDLSKRDLMRQAAPFSVAKGADVVPQATFEELRKTDIGGRPDKNLARFGEEGRSPEVPPVRSTGRDPLTERAYAESFNPVEPGERVKWELNEQGALQGKPELRGRRPYNPRTEREAIRSLERNAADIEASPAGEALRREEANIGRSMAAERSVAEERKVEIDLLQRAERDEKLLPIKDRIQTLTTVNEALHEKAKLIPERNTAKAERELIVKNKITKKADLVKVADDIEKVAKQNPEMLDDDLAVVEALLQDTRQEAQRVTEADVSAKQVQGVIDRIVNGKSGDIDVMLTTVGKNWKMLYEANGAKKAVLQEGDTIVEAELHRMFTNLYEIKKDPVLFGRTFNAFTNLFKTYATLTPGFHVRNALSAIFMNATDGVPLRTQFNAAGLWREYMNNEDSASWLASQPKKIQDAFAVAHASGAGGRFTEAGFAENVTMGAGWLNWMDKVQRNKVTRLSQRVGSRVEGSVRLAMALDSMNIGESIEAATQRVNRIHFDYGEISQLDDMMKRVIPFWTFMSRNMPMQVSQMWSHPQVYTSYERFVNNFSAEDEEYTPEYWTKAGAWNTGLKMPGFIPESFGGGLPIYASPDLGYTRLAADLETYEQFLSGKDLGGVLSQANPLLSAPVEFATRKDIFTGQEFEDDETVPVSGIQTPIKWLGGLLGQNSGGEVDAAFMNSVRALNPLVDRSSRLLPQLTGSDPEGQKRMIESWLRTVGGVPVRTLTPKQQDNEYFRRYYDQLDAAKRQQERASRKAG